MAISGGIVQLQNTFVLSVDGPVDAIPRPGRIWGGYLRGVKNVIRKLGGDPYTIIEHYEIDPMMLEDPDHDVDCGTAVNLIDYCSRSLSDPLFGLHLAEQQGPDCFGCAVTLARCAPTFRQALQSLIDYVPVSASPECELEMIAAREAAELRWRSHLSFGETEQMNLQGLLLLMKTLQMLGGQHFHPRYATLKFGIPQADIQLLQDRLGCKVSVKAEANAIGFSAELLDYPTPTSNRTLYSVLGGYLSHLRVASRPGVIAQIEAYVRGALPTKDCSVDGCAEKLGTSVRTLQKRLTRIHMRFSEIVQSERVQLAKNALLWTDWTLDEIAFQLGYSEQTSFGRAFKRSTGMTPQAFRAVQNSRNLLRPCKSQATPS